MNLEEELRALRQAATKSSGDRELERQLERLRSRQETARTLPAERVPHGIEHYVEGRLESSALGEYFVARQTLPFGRPYGKLRVGDVSASDLESLSLFLGGARLPDPSQLIYLDTETTGLAGGTGTCAFLIGVGIIEGADFVVQQYFLRDYPDEKAILEALGGLLGRYQGLVTYNGKTFDVPLLETRYALARQRSPFARMVHLDLLHPARHLWRLRLESCKLTHLEREVLGISRTGDVAGSEIPAIYFDYLRSGDARGLQPVFYHNALDIITLAALTVEIAQVVRIESGAVLPGRAVGNTPSLDLFSLSRILERAGESEKAVSLCLRAIERGLPEPFEPRALWHLATQHKRRGEYARAVELWEELARRQAGWFVEALEQLAIHAEHRLRDARAAIEFTERALERLQQLPDAAAPAAPVPLTLDRTWHVQFQKFTYRRERLRRKAAKREAKLLGGLQLSKP